MDESEALKILRQERVTDDGQTSGEKKCTKEEMNKSERELSISAALLGLFILVFLYNVLVHPIDKINLKMALTDSYAITTVVQGRTTTVLVDDNVIYANDKYYETVDNKIYVYEKNLYGNWEKRSVNSYGLDAETSWITELLDRENYKRNILFWKPMEYTGSTRILGMENVRTRVLFGKCTISGTVEGKGIFGTTVEYYTTIEIDRFGLVKLKTPEIYTNLTH